MASTDSLVSIIVPVYGTEAYLPACIESIQNQTYRNIQIILVDDRSPDRCPEICDSYAQRDSRILVIHQENKGVSGARNTGLQKATGEYILFVDSDDELYPNAVEVMLCDARNYGADIVWAPQKQTDKGSNSVYGTENDQYSCFEEDASVLLSLKGEFNINAVWGKLFRASFIEGICFEAGKNINEDGFYMFLCYMKKPRMVRHNVAVYKYNSREDSASRQAFSDKYLSMLYFCERKKELIAGHCPQYSDQANNMEVRTNLQLLDVMCSAAGKQYRALQRQCVQTVRRLYRYHKPINDHHKMLAWIVAHGLYPLYKWAVRMKYYR